MTDTRAPGSVDPEEVVDTESPTVEMVRDASAIVTWVEESVYEVLGWSPADLVGKPSTQLIHPEDQNSAVEAWFDMLASPGEPRIWRGRYRAADGNWRWVETVNRYVVERPDNATVATTMALVGGAQASVEEELRVREQILSRLSDALPVGLFQFDTGRQITFTNDRLHAIVGRPSAATTDVLFAGVVREDRDVLDTALSAALADRALDDVEITLAPGGQRGDDAEAHVVCTLALRPLTSRSGEVSGGIGCLSDVTERVQLRRSLEHRATTDPLTGLLNRSAVLAVLEERLSALGGRPGVAVAFLDLDGFKQVNDGLGHAAGDRVLQEVAERLRTVVRVDDRVGRIGGDEFLVVCSDVDGPGPADQIAQRFAGAVEGPLCVDDETVDVRASIGVAWTGTATTPDVLIARADEAMYADKAATARRVG